MLHCICDVLINTRQYPYLLSYLAMVQNILIILCLSKLNKQLHINVSESLKCVMLASYERPVRKQSVQDLLFDKIRLINDKHTVQQNIRTPLKQVTVCNTVRNRE